MSKKIYFIADSHITRLIYSNRPELHSDTYRALLSAAELIALEGKEAAVVFCGDNFDTRSPTPEDIRIFRKAVDIMTDAGVKVYGIEGNHDRVVSKDGSGKGGWISLIDGVEHINRKTVNIHGVYIHGLDYVQGSGIYEDLEKVPECDILVIHQPFAHISPFEPNAIELECLPDQVRKGVVAGHVHMYDIRKTANGVRAVSPGSTHAVKLGSPEGSFAVYDIDKDKFSRVATPYARRMVRFECDNEINIKDMMEDLSEILTDRDELKPVVGIKYRSDLSEAVIKAVDEIGNRAHVFLKVIPEEADEIVTEDSDIRNDVLLNRLFKAMKLEDELDGDLYEAALAIVDGFPDKAFELIRKKEKARDEITKDKT